MIVDLGTGDGRHVLRTARARPSALVVGVDPVAEAMAASARRAGRKPARGGVDNALFVVASLERLPLALRGLAWGSDDQLSLGLAAARGRVAPAGGPTDRHRADRAGGIGGRAAQRERRRSAEYADRLDLPPLEDRRHVHDRLAPAWREAGLADVRWRYLAAGKQAPHRTTWGQRLVRGSGRQTLVACGRRPDPSTSS